MSTLDIKWGVECCSFPQKLKLWCIVSELSIFMTNEIINFAHLEIEKCGSNDHDINLRLPSWDCIILFWEWTNEHTLANLCFHLRSILNGLRRNSGPGNLRIFIFSIRMSYLRTCPRHHSKVRRLRTSALDKNDSHGGDVVCGFITRKLLTDS
jgi:hypothetical protein